MAKQAKPGNGVDELDGGQSRRSVAKSGKRWGIAGIVLAMSVAALAGLVRDRRGQADGTVETITQNVQDASATVMDTFVEARTSARNLGLAQQIEARLRNDKALDAEKIDLHVEDESTAILEGLVPDATAKEKAVALTRDTRGVLQVVDHLAVPPPPRVIAAPSAAAPPEVTVRSRVER